MVTVSGLQSVEAASSFRNIPSPEQGASTMTRSKNPAKVFSRSRGCIFSTRALGIPMRSMFRDRILARLGLISLDTSRPWPFIASANWVDLPPGAAQRSRTRSPGRAPSMAAGAMAEGS